MANNKMAEIVLTCKDTGRQGGIIRARNLSADRRAEIARKAALARWAKKTNPDPDGPDSVQRPISDATSILLNSRRPKPCHNTRTRKSSSMFNFNLFEMEAELAIA